MVACEPDTNSNELETFNMQLPPPRGISYSGYEAPPELVTWKPFTYSLPHVRRAAVRDYVRRLNTLPQLPPLRIVLMGGVAAGKGTTAPMLSQAFKMRVLGVGSILRGEARAGRARGIAASEAMARGELLPDGLVLQLLRERLSSSLGGNLVGGGCLLDGFPRTVSQAESLLLDEWRDLRPDAVVLIERPDELVKEFSLGRCSDSTTGQTYHPKYAPPPPEVHDRLVWRVDDTFEVLMRRLEDHKQSVDQILAAFTAGGVPVARVDNARSELETFGEIADFLEEVAMRKLAAMRDELLRQKRQADRNTDWAAEADAGAPLTSYSWGGAYGGPAFQSGRLQAAEALSEAIAVLRETATEEEDIATYCAVDEDEDECVTRYRDELSVEEAGSALFAAVRRCNTYDVDAYMPVLVGDEQVGWANSAMLEALAPALAIGSACEVAMVSSQTSGDVLDGLVNVVRLAPHETGVVGRTAVVNTLVEDLVADGFIPRHKLRNELQDVNALAGGVGGEQPLLRMERAAVIYFGMERFGVHVNGWVRDPNRPSDPTPVGMWVAKRAMSKATYPGLLDQVVAGGQPSGLSFDDNVRKECEEEASLPPEIINQLQPTGAVNYRYTTRKGLSTATIVTYDLELPPGLLPLCADGEVEEFTLMPLDEVLRSLREDLPLWRPNAALVAIDFLVKRGVIDRHNEPAYEAIAAGLRAPRIISSTG